MYSVSADYLTALASPVARFRLSGTVGSTPFTEENVVFGTFTITNNVSEGHEIKLGSVYVGQLKATFTGLSIARGAWLGKEITVSEGLQLADESFEDVPLGVYTVAEANHTLEGVEVVAYDNMTLFDKPVEFDQTTGDAYSILDYLCGRCSVTLANTQEEIEALPNGTETFSLYADNDIETWRDLLSWVAQTLCAIATINRDGDLELRQYSTTSSASIDASHRFTGCSFSDYECNYTGMSVVDVQNNATNYYYVTPDDGLTYNLGSNPFLQYFPNLTQNIIDDFATVSLVPFSASMLGGAIYDLCDCLTFTGGIAAGAVCGVMSFVYSYNRGYRVEGYGSNPDLANAKSKTDKEIAGLISAARNEIIYYDYVSTAAVTVADGNKETIIIIRFAPTANTHIDFHAEIKHDTSAEMDVKVQYLLNGIDLEYYPQQIELAGTNLLHLLLTFNVQANTIYTLTVKLEADGGDISIAAGDVRAYLAGYGISTNDLPWDGNIDLSEEWTNENIPAMTVQAMTDAVVVRVIVEAAIIDTSSTVTRSATYTEIVSNQFVLKTEYTEQSTTQAIDSGYCTKVTPFVTGLTVSDVVIV